MIIIMGLGPGDPRYWTRETMEVLEGLREIYVRTRRHPAVAALPPHLVVYDFDAVYAEAENLEAVYERIAHTVLELGRRPEGVCYAVPGSPFVGEATVARIRALAAGAGIPIRIVHGLSFIETALELLGLDALDGLQIADAFELAERYHPPLNPDRPALIAQVDSRTVAADLKLTLMNQYPPEHPVTLIDAAGLPEARQVTFPLYQLDHRSDFTPLTALYVPPLARPGAFETFQDTIAHLRSPEGCPWDREQTHQSLRANLLEEAYEVLEALDADDPGRLKEELGDLLLQIVFHSQIAVESGEFSMAEVIAHVNEKIRRRHPHVFGDLRVTSVRQVLENWEQIKQQEKAEQGQAASILDGVPKGLPALAQAAAYGERAARLKFDWSDAEGVLEKLQEELREIAAAADLVHRAAEFGDLLFTLAQLARHWGIDPEAALREANARFARRFRQMEAIVAAQGRRLQELSPEEMEALWAQVKQAASPGAPDGHADSSL
ncbi:nucleoside triphosphate pyrophosphohydrolase [Thermoflexus sp.]|uniref:nucleoside triphosphate pyrophosphohydrolase n=1 Tax=Thermoflexus sp. TaxID=1969742 RepID=UPI0035E430B5